MFAIKHVLQDKKYKNRELEITQHLNHPNIVKLERFFYQNQNQVWLEPTQEEYLNLVLEYVPDTLSRVIKNNKRDGKIMKPEFIRSYSEQMFKALEYLNVSNNCYNRESTFVIVT
jgi:glycogen synthase kinase 3 beta